MEKIQHSYNELIIHKHVCFIHIPKSSGTSFQSNQIRNLNHKFNVSNVYRRPASLRGYRGYWSDRWEVCTYPKAPTTKMSIIRNPFDLLCSYYFHGNEYNEKIDSFQHSGWSGCNWTHKLTTFKEFIQAYCDPDTDWHVPAFKNFLYSQLFDANHNCVADVIIKYEYRKEAIDILNTKLKHPIVNRVKNKSKRKQHNYKKYYDDEMIALVNEKCKKELELFHYDFNGSTKYEPLILNCKVKYDVHNNTFL